MSDGHGGCTWSQGGVTGPGVGGTWSQGDVTGPGGHIWSQGGVPGPGGGVPGPRGVPGPGGCTWSQGVYLVPGVYLVQSSVSGPRGMYLVLGVYLVPGGAPSPGGYLPRNSPRGQTHTCKNTTFVTSLRTIINGCST